MIESIIVDRRFRGPPESGNGGYVAGMLGRLYAEGAVVTLRRPPPLGLDLTRAGHGGGRFQLLHGDSLIAESEPTRLEMEVPDPPSFDLATEASRGYIGFADHHFGGCFVCGPDREAGDGLRIFAGDVPGRDIVAAPWIPDATLADAHGIVKPEFLWAALDCPGYFALHSDRPPSLMLLGRFAARVEPGVRVGERCVIVGWELGRDGRKSFAGTAIFAENGRLIGKARAIWIRVGQPLW